MTLTTQIEKLKRRFELDHVVLVGDRGMITQARITEDIKSAGLERVREAGHPSDAFSSWRPGRVGRMGPDRSATFIPAFVSPYSLDVWTLRQLLAC